MIRLFDRLQLWLERATGLLCLVLLGCLFVEVLNRYVLGISWPEIQFIIPFCFLWMCMLASATAVRRRQHFEVDLISVLFSERGVKIHQIVILAGVALGGLVLAWSSIAFLELGLLKKNPSTGIRMIYIYASLFLGSLLIALFAVERIINAGWER
ncbi:TRAP transporter small permease [Nitratireductor sp. CH_MIT9313-5]|jgi:TRAP-type C4-dicarboxylate transport system permease small subunit|uniref:TRAP transporter small permease n=1 Tax=Nitratireductor sp. CH_MIT9313-5 TaxID=3107764 RepID=UPI00300B6DBC